MLNVEFCRLTLSPLTRSQWKGDSEPGTYQQKEKVPLSFAQTVRPCQWTLAPIGAILRS